MSDDSRDTWPAPSVERGIRETLVLMRMQMDVMERELHQVAEAIPGLLKTVELMQTNLELVRVEVVRHGQRLSPVSTLPPIEDLAHD